LGCDLDAREPAGRGAAAGAGSSLQIAATERRIHQASRDHRGERVGVARGIRHAARNALGLEETLLPGHVVATFAIFEVEGILPDSSKTTKSANLLFTSVQSVADTPGRAISQACSCDSPLLQGPSETPRDPRSARLGPTPHNRRWLAGFFAVSATSRTSPRRCAHTRRRVRAHSSAGARTLVTGGTTTTRCPTSSSSGTARSGSADPDASPLPKPSRRAKGRRGSARPWAAPRWRADRARPLRWG
jgi:hypothetical protein